MHGPTPCQVTSQPEAAWYLPELAPDAVEACHSCGVRIECLSYAALSAGVALYFNWRSARAADKAARAAEEQTKIQRQLRIDAAQPYVWADIRPDNTQGTVLNVVVGNSGPTVAEKVKVKVEPPLPAIDQTRARVQIAQTILTDGIESLPPGRVLQWPLGQGFNLINKQSVPQSYKFTITARGPFGAVPALTYVV